VQVYESDAVLDREQLRDITMDDAELMRELLAALLEDTSNQFGLIESAIKDRDSNRCRRLAHYSKGACANVGAVAAAARFRALEVDAAEGEFDKCSRSLTALANELDRLRKEASAL
jgi:HPt (histidine-containing phosphotransfer) domain-containing protein